MLIFAAVTRYTPLAGLGFLQGPLTTPPTATGQAHVRGKPSELHQRGRHTPVHGLRSPLTTGLAAQAALIMNLMLNVIKTHTDMTTLDLNAYGVTEMSHAEKVENDGGFPWLAVAIAAAKAIAYVVDNREKAAEGASNGWESAGNAYKR